MKTITEEAPGVRLYPKIELEDGRTIGVRIRQAGPNEIRLDAPHSLKPGKISMLRIQTESGETLFQATADIHWTHPMAGGTSAGLYLNETLPEELLAWPEWDRRESLRYSLDIAARVWWKESRSSVPARIINYSSSGLGVICPEQVTLGSRAQIIAGRTLEDIVCVSAVPCWQVQTREGVTIGFELESMEGKRFGGYARQRWISPSASHISTQTQIVS